MDTFDNVTRPDAIKSMMGTYNRVLTLEEEIRNHRDKLRELMDKQRHVESLLQESLDEKDKCLLVISNYYEKLMNLPTPREG